MMNEFHEMTSSCLVETFNFLSGDSKNCYIAVTAPKGQTVIHESGFENESRLRMFEGKECR